VAIEPGDDLAPAADPDRPAAITDAPTLARRWALVLPHSDRLRRIARRRLGSADEADDVVQEALLRAVTFPGLDEAYVGQFLTTVTVRLCADVQRDRTRQLRVGVRDAIRTVAPHDPHDTLLDHAEARWLYDRMAELPQRESAVVLARARGLSVREAATHLGLGVKSAEAALTKARHRMRRMAHSASLTGLALLRRFKDVATPAAVATGLTVAAVGGGAALLGGHRAHPHVTSALPAPSGLVVEAAPLAGDATGPARAPRTARPSDRPVAHGTPAVTRPKPQGDPTITAPPVGDPHRVGTAPIKVEERHPEESFQESLADCVSHGIVNIAPPHVGVCDHGDE